jgi:hypothetical protein
MRDARVDARMVVVKNAAANRPPTTAVTRVQP